MKTPKADVKRLLQATQDGVEDAEALLPRFRAESRPGPHTLGRVWEAACQHAEVLADLRDEGQLAQCQDEQFRSLMRRIAALRSDLHFYRVVEPRLDWTVVEGTITDSPESEP